MIEETAVVTRLEDSKVWIKSLQAACGGCAQQAACSTATLAKWLPAREFPVNADFELNVGDKVCVSIDASALLLASVLLYLSPLLLMLAGVGLAASLLPTAMADDWLPEIALSVLLFAFTLVHRLQTRLPSLFVPRIRITRKV